MSHSVNCSENTRTFAAHVFHLYGVNKKWIPKTQKAVEVKVSEHFKHIICVHGNENLVNSTVTPNMFKKSGSKFIYWKDEQQNLIYGLGFSSEAELNDFENALSKACDKCLATIGTKKATHLTICEPCIQSHELFVCKKCMEMFKVKASLTTHTNKCKSNGLSDFRCHCDLSFATIQDLVKHKFEHVSQSIAEWKYIEQSQNRMELKKKFMDDDDEHEHKEEASEVVEPPVKRTEVVEPVKRMQETALQTEEIQKKEYSEEQQSQNSDSLIVGNAEILDKLVEEA